MDVNEQVKRLCRGCESVYSQEELRERLALGRPLRVKLGLDPTAPDIHLGHTVVLRKLRQFQDLGHKAVLIIGDYTAMIGDPTGKSSTRPMLSRQQIEHNAGTYFEQAARVLDTSDQRLEIRYNSEWLDQMTFADVLQLASMKTVARMLERDMFEKRFKAGQEIGIHELLYPLMQGWDSVCIQSDIELGGTEQTFNNLIGRDLQRLNDQPPQVVMIMPILVGLDGIEKMSKSLDNYVGVIDPPQEMFAKIMSIPDGLMTNYYTLLTDLDEKQYVDLIPSDPRAAKVALAKNIVAQYADQAAADEAETEFFAKMKGGLPQDIDDVTIAKAEIQEQGVAPFRLAVLCGFARTNGEARRLIREGGLRLNQQKLTDPECPVTIQGGDIVQRGKRKFLRIQIQ